MSKQWGVQSADGTFYRVGRYRDGEWLPGSPMRAIYEWILLHEFGSYPWFRKEWR